MLNFVKTYLKTKKATVTFDGKIKVGRKDAVDADVFYGAHIKDIGDTATLQHFKTAIQLLCSEKHSEQMAYSEDYQDVIEQCTGILEKYKWYRTNESELIFYVRTHDKAMQFKYLTTDFESHKFYTRLDEEERAQLRSILATFNANCPEGKKPIRDEVKFVNLVIKYMYKFYKYGFTQEPVTLSNKLDEYCFKFYDIAKLKRAGLHYESQNDGQRPATPAWDEFFGRIKDQSMVPLVKAFFAGIFMQKNTSKQVLYIYGEGNDGKTQVAKALLNEIGKDVSFSLPQNMKFNNFGAYSAYGKRFFMGDELRSQNVFKTGMLHSLTGGSPIQIEKKNEDAFSTELFSVGVLCSNYEPKIGNVENQTSRIIYIEMNKAKEEDRIKSGSEWKENLKKETRFMIYDGIKYFEELNPSGTFYQTPDTHKEKLKNLFDEKTQDVERFVQDCFVADEEDYVKANIKRAFQYYCETEIYPGDKSFNMPTEYRDNKIVSDILIEMRTQFPNASINESVKKINGKIHRVITGVSVKHLTRDQEDIAELLRAPKCHLKIAK